MKGANPWDLVLRAAFIVSDGTWVIGAVLVPTLFGFHAVGYTDATRAWLDGGNPWIVGPPAVVFAGPPTMLLLFVPFVPFGIDVIRFSWIAIDIVVAYWAVGRIGLPRYWLFFPPLFEAIALGHPEVLILGLIALGGPLSGFTIALKPYAALPLIAERRWRAIAVAVVAIVATAPFLPWGLFLSQATEIGATLARQNVGDSAFGQPVLMVLAAALLLSLGLRRALWLATPVLWPYAQPIYKVMTMPVLSPVVALIWAIPIPGMTLAGIAVEAILMAIRRRQPLPRWLELGITPVATGETVPGTSSLQVRRAGAPAF